MLKEDTMRIKILIFVLMSLLLILTLTKAKASSLMSVPGVKSQRIVYTIKKGDTLTKLAKRFLLNSNRWDEIWDLNRNRVPNPHRVEIGQRIIIHISGSAIVSREDVNKAQRNAIFQDMCIKRRVASIKLPLAMQEMVDTKSKIAETNSSYELKSLFEDAQNLAVILELHDLTDAIIYVSKNDKDILMAIMMAAIAKVEGGYILNIKGAHDEHSTFQFLPTTAQQLDPESNIKAIKVKLLSNPYYAAQLAHKYLEQLRDKYGDNWRAILNAYNGSNDGAYSENVLHCFKELKQKVLNNLSVSKTN